MTETPAPALDPSALSVAVGVNGSQSPGGPSVVIVISGFPSDAAARAHAAQVRADFAAAKEQAAKLAAEQSSG